MNRRNILILILSCWALEMVAMDVVAPITRENVFMLQNLSNLIKVPTGTEGTDAPSYYDDVSSYLTCLNNFFKLAEKLQKKDPNFGFTYANGVLTRLTDDVPNTPRREGLELVETILKQHILKPLLCERPRYFSPPHSNLGLAFRFMNYFTGCCPKLQSHEIDDLCTAGAYCYLGRFYKQEPQDVQKRAFKQIRHLRFLAAPTPLARLASFFRLKTSTGLIVVSAMCFLTGCGIWYYKHKNNKNTLSNDDMLENEIKTDGNDIHGIHIPLAV